jgi:hypothetical protein
MSIYSTLGQFGIKRFGADCYVDVLVQVVPAQVADVGVGWEFLPPPVDPGGGIFRAVFFVEIGERTGTERSPEEYRCPLLKLTGREYHEMGFADLITRLEAALDARYGVPSWKSNSDPEERRWYGD